MLNREILLAEEHISNDVTFGRVVPSSQDVPDTDVIRLIVLDVVQLALGWVDLEYLSS